MVLLRTALDTDELAMVNRMQGILNRQRRLDERLMAYFDGSIRIEQLGLALPPNLELLETIANWPRVHVVEHVNRMQMRAIMRPGANVADKALMEGFKANNIDSESTIHHTQTLIHGRGFVSVGTNEDDDEHPLIRVESPREMACLVDNRRRKMDAALRVFRADNNDILGTLMLPDKTLQIVLNSRGWSIDEVGSDDGVDEHELGAVPVVLFLNRRMTGDWEGQSEMTDVIPITNAAARALTLLQFASETHGVPKLTATGVAKEDFVDEAGRPIPAWQSYMNSIWMTRNPEAKISSLPQSSLDNFTNTIRTYGQLASSMTGLPFRYFGGDTANPPSADAIRADESRLVQNAQNMMRTAGDGWSWIAALYERFRTGEWLPGNQVQVEWHDAATPTVGARADSIQKLNGGTPVYSREGSWDELGWSEARKDRERKYFEDEAAAAADPVFDRLTRDLADAQVAGQGEGGGTNGATGGGE